MVRIGIFLPHWLGDACMATPTLRAISAHFREQADCRIVGIARPPVAELLKGVPWCDEFWYWKKSFFGQTKLVQRMRQVPFDWAFLLPNSFRVGALGWLSGAKRTVGFAGNLRSPFLTDRLPRSLVGREPPLVTEFLKLSRMVGCEERNPTTELATTSVDEANASQVWSDLRLGPHVVGLNCGSAKSPSRRWAPERFAELARRVVTQLNQDVLVLCGPGEEQLADTVVMLANDSRVVSFAEQPKDFGTTKACLARMSLLVSTDSGPRHIASAMGTPVVSIHGPVAPGPNANPLSSDLALVADLPCIDCRKDACPLGHNDCMKMISVESVMDAVTKSMPRRSAA